MPNLLGTAPNQVPTNADLGSMAFQDKESVAVDALAADSLSLGTLSTNPTVSAGTANGVAYLNGNKAFTTGSALTFDGTTLSIPSGELSSAKVSATDQTLNGITAQALHRSPNAVTAMFIYDTSKDSDGGAWTEKCQHTSWYNEPLNGKWLGAQASHVAAAPSVTSFNDYYQLSSDGKFYKARVNLLTKTEQFDDAAWTKNRGSISAQKVLAPDSTVTAYQFIENNTSATRDVNQPSSTVAAVSYTFSAYLKKGARKFISLIVVDDATGANGFNATFDVETGSVTQTKSLGTGTYITSSITPFGNGWYRCSVTGFASSTVSWCGISPCTTGTPTIAAYGRQSYLGDGVSDFYLWHPDLRLANLNASLPAYQAVDTGTEFETFRGNKAKFPKLAGIVAEASNVTIYDLTEPGRPMWMRFIAGPSSSAITMIGYVNAAISYPSIGAKEGSIVLITAGLTTVVNINIPNDNCRWTSAAGLRQVRLPLALRNSSFSGLDVIDSTKATPNASVRAVAMTVLPDAPVDPVSGLKVPTIAVASDSGVSVIKHNGTVVSGGSGAFTNVTVNPSLLSAGKADTSWYYAANPGSLGSGFTLSTATGEFGRGNTSVLKSASRTELVRSSGALVTKRENNASTPANSLNATITNAYNTGHLIGDIRRCYLSDNTVESVTGPELVTNGTFDTNINGWSVLTADGSTATISYNSGAIRIVPSNSAARTGAYQSFSVTAGKTYLVTGQIKAVSSAANRFPSISVGDGTGSDLSSYSNRVGFNINGISPSGFTTISGVFRPTGSSISVLLNNGGSFSTDPSPIFEFDNISVREAVTDRSYKAAGASITGTLTKSAVAPNAQLVAYSGFSAANYLQEPYSTDLDFGTGEWSAGAWVNVPTTLPMASFPTTGSTLTTNGTFDTDLTGWSNFTNGTVTLTWESGAIRIQGTAYVGANQAITTVVGKTYLLSADIVSITSGTEFGVEASTSATPGPGALGSSLTSGTGIKYIFFTATTTTTHVRVFANGGNFVADNVQVYEVNPSLICDRAHSTGAKLSLGLIGTGRLIATAYDGTTTRTVTTTSAYKTATWLKAEAVYKTDGSLAILVNGQEVAVTRGNPLLTLNNSNAVLTIGNSYALDAPFPGSIALLKLSATAPTYDQAQWMCEQEKQLFRDGAQCCLPDSGSIVDLTYDDVTDKWVAVSATNESSWTGLVRTNVTAVPAGSNSKVVATSGVKLNARTTTSPGVDVTIPAYGLREELLKDGEDSGKLARVQVPLDYVGGFTATTVIGNTAITSVAGLSYPSQTTIIGATVTGSGIPASTTVVGISGTTIYLSKAATADATGVQISFTDFVLPLGMEAKEVISGGAVKTEGATKDFTRLYDGFRETIRFGTAPGYTAAVQIIAIRSQS